jgi:pentatricopeptide repeat protein
VRLVEVLFNTLLDICASSHDLDRMSAIFAMMQDFHVCITNVTFGILIKAFGHAGRLERCHEVWDGMLAAKVSPTVVTYGCYIDACIRNKDIHVAQRIFDSMSTVGVRPNAVVYTSLIRGYASVGEPAKALLLYRQMRKDHVQPTSVTFNSVLDLVARQLSDSATLQSVLHDMREAKVGADSVICAILLKACCSSGKIAQAMELFREIRGKCSQWDFVALNALLLGCSRNDKMEDADEVFQEMRRVRAVPNNMAATAMVKMYARARMPQKAESVIEILQHEFRVTPSLQAYANLIQAFTQNKMCRRSLDVFTHLSEAGIPLDIGTSTTIIQNCIELGEYDIAMELVRKSTVQLQPAMLQKLLEAMRSSQRHEALTHELTTLMCRRYR